MLCSRFIKANRSAGWTIHKRTTAHFNASTVKYTREITLKAYLAAECAGVLGVLGDLHLLDGFPERRTIASAVLADDSDLLGSLCLKATT